MTTASNSATSPRIGDDILTASAGKRALAPRCQSIGDVLRLIAPRIRPELVDATGMADLLTVDGFDYDKVVEMVENSELGTLQKTTLKAGLEQARDNPELLQGLLDRVKEAMGL